MKKFNNEDIDALAAAYHALKLTHNNDNAIDNIIKVIIDQNAQELFLKACIGHTPIAQRLEDADEQTQALFSEFERNVTLKI